jgi:O-antigen/teichoic acid export membrane protein
MLSHRAAISIAAITGSAFMADRKAEHYLFQNIFMALRIPLLTPLAFLGTFGIFGSVGLAYLVASFFALLTLQRCLAAIRLEVDIDFIRKSIKFSSWNFASSIMATAPTFIIPIMVLNMLGEAEAAKYYIASPLDTLCS